mmetsp:Transcript_23147/g.52415  ORF Transcript_23147/g.52415 Transcript_23147/m.52415 type:complete len:248 (-) Transcript_23147:274-1017(-)
MIPIKVRYLMHRVQHGQTTATAAGSSSAGPPGELFRNEYAQSAVKCLTPVDSMPSQNAVASPVKSLPPRLRFSSLSSLDIDSKGIVPLMLLLFLEDVGVRRTLVASVQKSLRARAKTGPRGKTHSFSTSSAASPPTSVLSPPAIPFMLRSSTLSPGTAPYRPPGIGPRSPFDGRTTPTTRPPPSHATPNQSHSSDPPRNRTGDAAPARSGSRTRPLLLAGWHGPAARPPPGPDSPDGQFAHPSPPVE